MQGQGGPKDSGTGIGWLLAAAENGYQNVPPEKLAALRSKLTEDQQRTAQSIVDRYHVAALMAASPTEGIRNPALALQVARRLAKDEIQSDPQMFEAMAVAYAANGHFSKAASTEVSAIKKAKAPGDLCGRFALAARIGRQHAQLRTLRSPRTNL